MPPSSASVHNESRVPRIAGARLLRATTLGGYSALNGFGFETRLPPHVHANYVIGLVDAGAVKVTVNGKSWIAEPGMLVLLPPFVVHTELPVTPGGWSFRYLYPTEHVVREALGIVPERGRALPFACPVLRDPVLASGLARVFESLERSDALGTDEFIALLKQLRVNACMYADVADPLRREIRAIRAMITERPLRGVRLADLAAAAGLSQFHFSRLFRSEVGLPPYRYFEQVRIAFAHDLIQQGLDLSAVAFQLGFADQSHLTRHFHRGSFTTPGQYAQLARGLHSGIAPG